VSQIEQYAAPASLAESLRLLADGDATLFAGGTDLMPQTRSGAREFTSRLVNLRRIPELHGIAQTNGDLRVGALATVTEILESDLLRDVARILSETADCFACGQVRNTATIGGNICNASPAGDMIIPLLLLDAEVELACWSKGKVESRRMPLSEFFTGPGQTRILPTEILTSVRFSVPGRDFIAAFRKFGARPAMDISVVSVGVAGDRRSGVLENPRVAFGAVAPIPLRGRMTESVIHGKSLDGGTITDAAETAAEEVSPISDVRASAWYRRELIRTLTGRLLRHVTEA
jgi:CO/xanthine dehydrogenase FAD-binding subunit